MPRDALPLTDEAVAAAAALIALDLPAECVSGVRANLDLLREHLRNVEGFDVPEAPGA